MSYGRECLDNMMIDEAVEDMFEQMDYENKRWAMKNKKTIKISKMETSHIRNCMKIIEKNNFLWRGRWYKLFEDELYMRKHFVGDCR